MPHTFKVFRGSPSGAIVESETTRPDLSAGQVLLRITHSGLCGTDAHMREKDMALGHEGVGVVVEVGAGVQSFKVGDRAGWGFEHDSCMHCEQCLSGRETFCPERQMYGVYDLDQGSLATHAIWNASYLFAIPDSLSSEDAAPLMCAGATVFSALHTHGVESGQRVGVVGIGGLGHLCILFAAKMGCEVVVFSGTHSKEAEARKLGAREFVAAKDIDAKAGQKFDIKPVNHLLVTTSAQPDWALYLHAMAPGGTIYPLGVSGGDLVIPYMPIIRKGLRIQGCLVAARNVHNKMLEFAAFHGIRPMIETFALDKAGVEEAFARLDKGSLKYKAVLVAKDEKDGKE
ncbi:GroES-like protein [Athelia psychrophila]|uniref:GroES-like protein n=1 Tax=Athelia psychrophila TaxID=1759441 RepID=A0A166LA26_9AGAM|nr:GroES-like protein [Fibularhizoctonia sp. CBS 109695]